MALQSPGTSADVSVQKTPNDVPKPSDSASSELLRKSQPKSVRDSDLKPEPINEAAQSPLVLSKEALEDAAKGVVGEPEENENFDANFYKNLVSTRQHYAALRTPPNYPVSSKEEGTREYRVRARRVCPEGDDQIERIIVSQQKFCGSGMFSDVYEGFVVNVDEPKQRLPCAIKKLWPDPSKEDRQISLLRKLNHENLIKILYYYVCVHPKSKMSMWTLLIELMPSTVAMEQSKYILRGRIMPVIYAKLWIYQTLAGLAYLEQKNLIHLDIKPDNLLVNKETGRLKIGDFGSAKEYSKDIELSWYQVTRYYRAPELCFKFTKFDPTVDVWAAGCILVEMLTNRIIFFGNDNDDQLQKIVRILGTPTVEQLAQCIPSHSIDANLLKTNYPPGDWNQIIVRYNPRASKICTDFVGSILRYECNKRLRGVEALRHRYFNTIKDSRAKLPSGAPLPSLWTGAS
ncbi:hypothetical protein QR680_014189 [Steinernema hermaphroditum]|uniref:Protein kinase domain-containing protein n=1 Tax=Steinernema hermaphroditum TaxID=289476 RepID=A0AA39M3S6_9BILA|nr:hypothetical protein QR680_014189 [Steinernema hermaphroditum]